MNKVRGDSGTLTPESKVALADGDALVVAVEV
jgi:hypothetical protein